jgi:hypothetical protein
MVLRDTQRARSHRVPGVAGLRYRVVERLTEPVLTRPGRRRFVGVDRRGFPHQTGPLHDEVVPGVVPNDVVQDPEEAVAFVGFVVGGAVVQRLHVVACGLPYQVGGLLVSCRRERGVEVTGRWFGGDRRGRGGDVEWGGVR